MKQEKILKLEFEADTLLFKGGLPAKELFHYHLYRAWMVATVLNFDMNSVANLIKKIGKKKRNKDKK
mgnify:CR=1 FL=1